jgi:hypothetical protein
MASRDQEEGRVVVFTPRAADRQLLARYAHRHGLTVNLFIRQLIENWCMDTRAHERRAEAERTRSAWGPR